MDVVSGYPTQPRGGGWPEQPPRRTGGPGYAGSSGARRRRRRRGRGWIAALIVLLLLVIAFVVGDQVARSYAQNMIAAKFKSDGMSVKPNVSIKGWPFLTQVAERDVRTIDISANDFTQDKLTISRLQATASGVHINASFNGATVSSITGSALITYSSVIGALGIPGLTITADPSAGPNVAKVSEGPISVTADVVKAGPYTIAIRPQSIQGLPIYLPSSYTLNLPHFPAGIQLSSVSLTSRGLVLSITARNATLSQSG